MKVILIEEERFAEVAELMKGTADRIKGDGRDAERLGITNQQWEQAVEAASRRITYDFVRWAQSHGASTVR